MLLAIGACAGVAAADVILQTYADSLTTYKAGKTKVQDARPRVEQRGVNLDGSLRRESTHFLSVEGNPFESVWDGEAELNDVRLDTGTWSPTEVDISLPATVPWVIGRSFNSRQDNAGQYDSDAAQGWNWHQSSQPEIVLYDDNDNTKDVLYLVYGADRYVEFNRTGSSATTYKSKNGAGGVFEFVDGNHAAIPREYDEWRYHAPDGILATFFGFDTGTAGASGAYDGQVWKVVNANGDTAYAGHSSSATSALSLGYNATGTLKLAYDSVGREFTYAYSSSTIGGKNRLESVIVTQSATEIARVEYGYYPDSPSPTYGDPGDLRTVTTTLPLGDSINDIRVQYYRYYEGAYHATTNRGYQHGIMLVLDHEGTRNYDWADTNFDSDFLTETTANLKEYASVYLEYDASRRIDVAWFNGKCGCGSAGSGTHNLRYETTSYSALSGYDAEIARRTVVTQPDGTWVTQYFDELGQAMSRGVHDEDPDGGSTSWVTRVERDSMGCVVAVATPANIDTYDHDYWTITGEAALGLVRGFARVSSTDVVGFLEHETWREGASGTAQYLGSNVWWTNKATKSIGSGTPVVLVRPLIKEAWEYPVADDDDWAAAAHKVSYDYTTYSGVSEPLALETMTKHEPQVDAGKNGGAGSGLTTATHFKKTAETDFVAYSDGANRIVRYRVYANGQAIEMREDAETTAFAPTGFDDDGTTPIDDTTELTYDSQGRRVLKTDPGGRVSKYSYSRLADRRLVTIEFPRYLDLSTDEYYGPAHYTVTNHAGKVEASGVIALDGGDSVAATSTFIDEGDDDPITAVDTDASGPYDFGQVAQLRTLQYDKSGTQVQSERAYFVIPSSSPGSDGTHYDETTYKYDEMGRRVRTKAPHGTINRTVYDERGQAIEHWIGTNDADEGGTDNIVKTDATTFDINGYVTGRTAYIQDSSTGQRVTSFINDLRGRPVVATNPTVPHALTLYDNLGRTIAVGLYSSVSGLDEASDPTDDISFEANRLALTQTFYDERGRIWKTQRHNIHASGSNDDTLESLTWYDRQSRVAKRDGEQLEKFAYDRLGRQTHRFVLAVDDDADWEDTLVVSDDDVVLEEFQTAFDIDGKEIMSAVISRFYNDLSTSEGPLDDDGGALTFTATDVEGRIQITAKWYDDWDRLWEIVQYGTKHSADNSANFNRSGLSVPARSADELRTTYTYNTDGTLKEITDPKALVTRTEYDALGRRTRTIANYDDGSPSSLTADDDQVVIYGYTDGLQTSITADLYSGDQTTTYTFGTTKGSSGPDSKIATGHLLRKVQYPDSADATNDIVAYAYNAQSQEIWKRDQATSGNNSDYNIIETEYDLNGRTTNRLATQLRGITDGYVQRIATAYDPLGRVSTVTQHSAPTSGSVRDEVKYLYDGWGNITNFRQDKDSTVGGSGFWEVAYELEKATDGRNTLRRTEVTIPGASYLYDYRDGASFHDHNASRVTMIQDENETGLVSYQYNGVGQVVRTYLEEPLIYSKLYNSGGTTFGRLDRFDRRAISSWTKDLGTDRDIYKVTLAYDANSNIVSQDDAVHTGHDVLYTNDDLNRLIDAEEGTLSGTISSRTRHQTWTLTQTGNWELDRVDLDGDDNWNETGELNDDRTHNAVNELTARDTDDNSSDNYTFAYDAAGNMTDDGEAYKYEWDAFYRLRKVKTQGNALVSEYWYNGLGYLVTRHQDTDTDLDVDGSDKKYHTAYDERWRPVATFRDTDSDPKEQFLYHAAGAGGFGGSSYIDLVVMRDKDADTAWTTASDGVLEERIYYCQNWHADVVALVELVDPEYGTVAMVEWDKYSAYGVPFGMPMGDADSDGDCDSADDTQVNTWKNSGPYDVRGDTDLDGDVDAGDYSAVQGGHQALGRGVLTASGVANRKGYAGYEVDMHIGRKWHIRHRVLTSTLGRWLRRDPLGFSDGYSLLQYGLSNPASRRDGSGLQSLPPIDCGESNWVGVDLPAPPESGLVCATGTDGLLDVARDLVAEMFERAETACRGCAGINWTDCQGTVEDDQKDYIETMFALMAIFNNGPATYTPAPGGLTTSCVPMRKAFEGAGFNLWVSCSECGSQAAIVRPKRAQACSPASASSL